MLCERPLQRSARGEMWRGARCTGEIFTIRPPVRPVNAEIRTRFVGHHISATFELRGSAVKAAARRGEHSERLDGVEHSSILLMGWPRSSPRSSADVQLILGAILREFWRNDICEISAGITGRTPEGSRGGFETEGPVEHSRCMPRNCRCQYGRRGPSAWRERPHPWPRAWQADRSFSGGRSRHGSVLAPAPSVAPTGGRHRTPPRRRQVATCARLDTYSVRSLRATRTR